MVVTESNLEDVNKTALQNSTAAIELHFQNPTFFFHYFLKHMLKHSFLRNCCLVSRHIIDHILRRASLRKIWNSIGVQSRYHSGLKI